MPKDNENIRLPVIGPVEPEEAIGFGPGEMLRCDECLRANPPTRVNCLYCGAALTHTEATARLRKPILTPPEKGQPGYNVVLLPGTRDQQPSLDKAAALLKLPVDNLQRIISVESPLPLASISSREEAQLLLERLTELGIKASTIADDEMGLAAGGIARIRSLKFAEDGLTVQSSGPVEADHVGWPELTLIVRGRLFTRRFEMQERKSRKAENKIVDSSQFFADEAVFDIYASSRSQTWRIAANNFDFSCLESQKTLVTTENMNRLVSTIVARATDVEVDDSYTAVRQILDPVWPCDQETEAGGWRRGGPGRYSLGAVTINSNETQFTRYSRLRYFFKEHSPS